MESQGIEYKGNSVGPTEAEDAEINRVYPFFHLGEYKTEDICAEAEARSEDTRVATRMRAHAEGFPNQEDYISSQCPRDGSSGAALSHGMDRGDDAAGDVGTDLVEDMNWDDETAHPFMLPPRGPRAQQPWRRGTAHRCPTCNVQRGP